MQIICFTHVLKFKYQALTWTEYAMNFLSLFLGDFFLPPNSRSLFYKVSWEGERGMGKGMPNRHTFSLFLGKLAYKSGWLPGAHDWPSLQSTLEKFGVMTRREKSQPSARLPKILTLR
jgi:hypothetical protein